MGTTYEHIIPVTKRRLGAGGSLPDDEIVSLAEFGKYKTNI